MTQQTDHLFFDIILPGKPRFLPEEAPGEFFELYKQLLERAHQQLEGVIQEDPTVRAKKRGRFQPPTPQLLAEDTNQIWLNFEHFYISCGRTPEHIQQKIAKYLNVDTMHYGAAHGTLVFSQHIAQHEFEEALDSYIERYVFCKVCRGPDTVLQVGDSSTVIECNICGSKVTVHDSHTLSPS